MNKRNLVVTICLQAVCWGIILGILLESNSFVKAHTLLQSDPTPVPFLGPIYYGRHDIWNIVDHDKPLASTGWCNQL